ncbi:3-oxoacyl-(acyl-carrier-protein) reductase [Burkholderia sp. lig30]|nr:3-oxoacyl-(acyl-carrier-protein) reductase [Burkholderia sp. lig30]
MIFVITGGSRGIGAEIVAQAVAAGHSVAFTYNTNEAAAQRIVEHARSIHADAACKAYPLDVRDSAAVDAFADSVLRDFGTVDVVVSNAGVNRNALLMSMSDEEWSDVLEVNLTGAFHVARAFVPAMLEKRFGRFVFLSSLSRDGLSGQANYAATKAGLLGLSRTIAKEYGKRGITSNVVAPGMIDTDMSRENMSDVHGRFWEAHSTLRRVGSAAEVASAVMFFAQPEAAYINGTCLPVTSALDWVP